MTGSRLLLVAAQNVVPASGWLLGGWSAGTALLVYWIENLVLAVAIGIRIDLHRRATHLGGHREGFLRKFLLTTTAFTLVHGVFVGAMLTLLRFDTVDWDSVRDGARWVVLSHALSLAVDLVTLRRWPFAEVRRRAEWTLGRVGLVHFAILIGMFVAAVTNDTRSIFTAFVVMKGISEIGSVLPQWRPAEAPRALAAVMDLFPTRPGQESFAEYWRRTTRAEHAAHMRDEEVQP